MCTVYSSFFKKSTCAGLIRFYKHRNSNVNLASLEINLEIKLDCFFALVETPIVEQNIIPSKERQNVVITPLIYDLLIFFAPERKTIGF
jgi:hypothetical protein